MEGLWKDYFRDPSLWWDTRRTKTNPRSPDFKHKLTKESLWMDGRHNPSWVTADSLTIKRTEEPCVIKGMRKAQDATQERLSLADALASLEAEKPSDDDLASILRSCTQERNRTHALRLHAYMRKHGLEADPSLGNHLLSMLVEVGSMPDAQQVFDGLIYRNESSWNSLITGYAKRGELQHALILYQQIQEDDAVHLSGHTFVALLKVCAKLRDLERGREIHADAARKGLLERDLFVGSTLVDMYAKCGSLVEAQEVFDKQPVRNVVLWTALIAGYSKHGCGKEALHCFEQMHLDGVSPNAVTFVCSLKACGSIRATEKGQEIHAEVAKRGLEKDLLVGSALVDMYARCGLLAKAQEVFDKLPVRNVVSWTALIAGYTEHGRGVEALNCFEQMQLEGVSPDAVTYICSLKACGSIGASHKGQEIHAEIARKGLLKRDLLIASTLVDMYCKCGLLAKAQEVFDKLPSRDVVSWNALIAGYVKHKCGEIALKCFEQMQREGISPDAITFACSLNACASLGATDKGGDIHAKICREGLLEKNLVVGNALVDMYAKCGLLATAQVVFGKLPVQGVVAWNALIAGYAEHEHGEEALNCFKQMQHKGISPNAATFVCVLKACGSLGATDTVREIHTEIARKGLLERDHLVGSTLVDMYAKCGLLAKAQEVFDKLPVRDVVSWTALIAGYAEHGCGEEALKCFDQMKHEGGSPSAVTFACSLKACGSIGAIDKGREIHAEIASKGKLERDLSVGNALIDMYAKCGLPAKAQEMFDKLPVQDVVSWTALIAGYAQVGESEKVFLVFDRMIREGRKPNLITFLSVLNACSHAGIVEKGQMYFEAMNNDYGIIPTLEHHTCMVDLLGRAGQVDKAVAMIKRIPLHPNLVVWRTVLGACRKWGNVELGRQAFEHAVQLDEKDAAAYVCMSNIYGDADMQENVGNDES